MIARDSKTKDLKLCIEISGENSAYTKDAKRLSFQYKSFFNKPPKEENLPSLIEWYKTLNIDNSRCYDVYWEEKVDGDTVAVAVNRGPVVVDDDFDLPF